MPYIRHTGSNNINSHCYCHYCCSVTESCPTVCNSLDCSTPGFLVLHYLPEVAQTYILWVNDAIQPSHPVAPFSSCPQSFPASESYPVESALCIKWWKCWRFSFSISPSNEYSELISFRIDWFDLAVQGTLRSLVQHHNLKASILWCSAFFILQLSHLYLTTGKTIALTIGTFVTKVMSLFFNILSRFVIAFLPRSKCLLIHGCSHHLQWFWSPICHYFHFFLIYLP